METLNEFKKEFNLIADKGDIWGEAMSAWFECAGQMNKRYMDLPLEWQYSPGAFGDGTDEESYWYELFENTPDDILTEIGGVLFRYVSMLEYQGKSY